VGLNEVDSFRLGPLSLKSFLLLSGSAVNCFLLFQRKEKKQKRKAIADPHKRKRLRDDPPVFLSLFLV
jgi:hypothetical protein